MQINNTYSPQFSQNPKNHLFQHRDKIISMIEAGVSIKEISTELNSGVPNIYRFLKTQNITPTCRHKKQQEKNVNEILNKNINLFLDNNLTIEAIAQKTLCTIKEINNWLLENNSKIKKLLRLEMFKKGMPAKEVARTCGISTERAHQLKRSFQKDKLLPQNDLASQIQNDLKAGMSTKAIAKKYNLTPSTIYRYRKLGGITENIINETRKNQILTMAKEGLSIRAMAKELNISEVAIKNIIKKYNLKSQIKTFKAHIEDMILEDSQNGVFIEKLAETYGYSKRTISYKIKRAKERLKR